MLYNLQKVLMLHRTQNIQHFVIRCICANLASYNILAGYTLKLLVGYIANGYICDWIYENRPYRHKK